MEKQQRAGVARSPMRSQVVWQGQLHVPCDTLGCCRDSGEMEPFVPLAVFVTKGGDSLFCPGRCLMAAAWGEHIDQGKKRNGKHLIQLKDLLFPAES